MTAILEHAPQARPGIVRRFSIMATVDDRYLILDGDGRPVPTVARDGEPRETAGALHPVRRRFSSSGPPGR
jgi:hypothetical protein